jgi:membrane associated rhomboid family serine protease
MAMIPIRDDVPTRVAPVVVVSLIAANAVVFLYEIWLAAGEGADAGGVTEFIHSWGLIPREFLRGAVEPKATEQLVWLTPITAMFIHGGLLHLAGNLLYLWIFGNNIEDLLGHGRFLVLYLACGLAAAAVQVASDPASYSATVGASGAISGVLGAYAVSYPMGRLRLLWPRVRVPAVGFLVLWVAIQIVSGVGAWGEEQAPVAWWAHVGGFGAGVALGRAMWVRKPTRSRLRS